MDHAPPAGLMADNVVNLDEAREDRVSYWRCDCGCYTFWLRDDAEVECAHCGDVSPGSGSWNVPRGPTNDPAADGRTQIELGHPDDALESLLRFVRAESTAAVVVCLDNGNVRAWGHEFDTRARRGWLRRRLEDARRLLVEE